MSERELKLELYCLASVSSTCVKNFVPVVQLIVFVTQLSPQGQLGMLEKEYRKTVMLLAVKKK